MIKADSTEFTSLILEDADFLKIKCSTARAFIMLPPMLRVAWVIQKIRKLTVNLMIPAVWPRYIYNTLLSFGIKTNAICIEKADKHEVFPESIQC